VPFSSKATVHITIVCILTGWCFSDINKQVTVASPFATSEFFSWGRLKDEMYRNAPQAEDDNLDKINVLHMMMSVNQTKQVVAP
jgi:hypothetical protein